MGRNTEPRVPGSMNSLPDTSDPHGTAPSVPGSMTSLPKTLTDTVVNVDDDTMPDTDAKNAPQAPQGGKND